MKRALLVIVMLIAVLSVIPSVSALGGPGLEFSDAQWLVPCNSGFAVYGFHVEWQYPIGYKISYSQVGVSASLGDYNNADTWVQKWFVNEGEVNDIMVAPPDGYVEVRLDVWAPTGILVTSSSIRGTCPDGTLQVTGAELYGNVPLPAARVMGHVQYDTPLYTEPNPNTARSETLKAGQTWFVVGAKTGTDGKQWYQVFAGGLDLPFVPASVMVLDGPLP